jgi:hypothetical protein
MPKSDVLSQKGGRWKHAYDDCNESDECDEYDEDDEDEDMDD